MLEKPDLSLHSRLAVQLRLAEKQILEKASASGRAKRLHFQKKLEEGASLPRFEESDIAFLENNDTDAKLPIILRKLEEVEEDQEQLLNGGGLEENGEVCKDEASVLPSDGGSGASRTEDNPKENSE